jgi:predicted dehydrogenase
MIRVGVTGLGFMGNMHSKCYQALENVKLAAICDIDEKKLKGGGGEAGNIEGAEKPLDLTDIELYTDFDKMLAEAKLDAVSITLPTYMHTEYTTKALQAGVNTLCEKPMAPTTEQCEQMKEAAKKSGKILQIGHCIRFWPEYVKAKEIIDSGEYGKVKAATFQRLSLTPTWSWDNWLMDEAKSGGALLDLHIHDSDYVQYLFGMPKAVCSKGTKGPSAGYGHIVTQYYCDEDCVITAEGGWMMSPSFGFEMSFNIVLDKAVIFYDCTRDPAFKVCPADADTFTPEVLAGDGYSREIAHFAKAVAGEDVPEIITPQQSENSVKIILAEKQSAESGEKVKLI